MSIQRLIRVALLVLTAGTFAACGGASPKESASPRVETAKQDLLDPESCFAAGCQDFDVVSGCCDCYNVDQCVYCPGVVYCD